jgi:hypothetical protein
MPCNTPQGEIEWFEKQYGTNNPDKLRDMLCRVLNEIGHQEPGIVLDQDIKDWFVKHKEWDKQRKSGEI